ncbi:uncharacterized protein MAM_05219 [Metarhizium album ARSEF 1941]|uniref:Velvet domain-containing protein n=1 Tax=Metarhizium album (strain ARSEF 1941) TaxID=1081103 RepID=A0A0B2WW23_METAS|nr:uncharacterized protein MAM_05219 [Metarhizium album ARSEF 1941]KHN97110.1 hypothetical protein MAM_05219 [Metarhizium album ARSEF 1941]
MENTSRLAVFLQPPAKVQVGGHLHPPFTVELSNAGDGSRGTYVGNVVVLRTVGNEDASKLVQGIKSVSGQLKHGSRDSYLFAFPELLISGVGEFRLRADIYRFENALELVGQVESNRITVDGNTAPRAMASKSRVAKGNAGRDRLELHERQSNHGAVADGEEARMNMARDAGAPGTKHGG